MGKNLTTCDWSKLVIPDGTVFIEVSINEHSFVFSKDGYDSMIDFLKGGIPLGTTTSSRTLMPGDHKARPVVSAEAAQQILEESKVAEAYSLDTLGAQRKIAQQKLDAVNNSIREEFVGKNKESSSGFKFDWDWDKKNK